MMMLARRLAAGLIAAALMVLWAILIMRIDPHAEVICAAAPQLAMTLGLAFAGLAPCCSVSPAHA